MPFDLPASETHGFWVDLHVPTETPPGDYRGVYRVTADGGKSLEVPVTLTVWSFTLPQTPALVTAFGSPAPRMRDYYRQRAKEGKDTEPSDWQAVEAQCAQLLSEHCCNATPPGAMLQPVAQSDGSFQIPSEQVRALREFVDRYHVNALEIPHPSSVTKDPVSERDKLRAWLAAFDRAAKELDRPHVVFYVYLKDEPNTREDYEYVQKWGRAIREAKSIVQVMVVEQTWTEPGNGGADSAWGDLYGAVDIWCPLFSLHRQDSAAKRQALGETVWTYTALCQGPPTPWWHIDYPLLNYRVPAWMAWRDGMKGLLYWGGMSYWRETDDPWLHAPVYTGRGEFQQGDKGIRFNGEGSLVYPARAVGYDGIVPTIRLKALRDAIEDYEYLAMLGRSGKSAEADRVVRRLTESWFQWDEDPVAYEKARAELAAMIVQAGVENVLPDVRVVSLPEGALVPDVTMDENGMLHMVYGLGDNAWYVRSADNGRTFSPPVRVNTKGKVTLKMGERGPKLALGKGGSIHVVWADQWSPGVKVYPRYSRSLDGGKTFEPPRALASLFGIDGLTVAGDGEGNVVAFFHQVSPPQQEIPEAHRLYLARSMDDGTTFGPEERLTIQGMDDLACSMCMMRARITADGNVGLALRVANDNIRDFFLLRSPKRENAFTPLRVNEDRWELTKCPMCGPELTLDPAGRMLCAFMSRHRVYWSAMDSGLFKLHVPTPASENDEIYPATFSDGKGHVLLVWQVGPMAVGRTATVKWALFGNDGVFTGKQGTLGVSTSGTKATAFLGTDGAFYIVTTAK